MNVASYPLKYLKLRGENNNLLLWNDFIYLLAIIFLLVVPFLAFPSANYFHKDGLLDRVGEFSSVLTGFYVAGLVAVATFAEQINGLDKTIQIGRIKLSKKTTQDDNYLTRRQYVCSMFGYLAFLSLAITLCAIVTVTIIETKPSSDTIYLSIFNFNTNYPKFYLRTAAIIAYSIPIASLTVTTFHGLYYLIDRLYAVSPTVLPDGNDDE